MQTLFTGIQPTNDLTIGNYISLKNFLKEQDNSKFIFSVVNLHAITVPKDPKTLREMVKRLFALYVVAGVDIDKSILFVQSDVPEHCELSWLLTCNSYMGELNRMTQFKDKVQRLSGQEGAPREVDENGVGGISIPTGLYMYPVLMAADILLYDTDYVPVGIDQKQHVELARNIAERFNNKFGDTFVVPKPLIAKVEDGAKILALDDPVRKMSKSDPNKLAKISMNYTPKEIKASISKAVTDSEGTIRYAPEEKPGISNLMVIYSKFSGLSVPEIEKKFAGVGYGVFKKELTEIITDDLMSVQTRVGDLVASGDLPQMMEKGKNAAREIASKVLKRAQDAMGI